jgi:2-C-methyl-D-erythritol 4-phosphate cytidylyltransferase
VLALVPATGQGRPPGGGVPEAMVPVAGVPLVSRSVRTLLDSGSVHTVVVVVRAIDVAAVRSALGEPGERVVVVPGQGGPSSLRAALEYGLARCPDPSAVLVHEARRALAPPALITAVAAAVADGHAAAVPVLPLSDTVKELDSAGTVVGTAHRSALRVVQGPWACALSLLTRMLQPGTPDGTWSGADRGVAGPAPGVTGWLVAMAERLGEPVFTVPGDPLAFPITTDWDIRIAELLLSPGSAASQADPAMSDPAGSA